MKTGNQAGGIRLTRRTSCQVGSSRSIEIAGSWHREEQNKLRAARPSTFDRPSAIGSQSAQEDRKRPF